MDNDIGTLNSAQVAFEIGQKYEEVRSGRIRFEDYERFEREQWDALKFSELSQEEKKAADIIGLDKVIGHRDVTRAWTNSVLIEDPIFPFSEEVLVQCAEENQVYGLDWRLFYIQGFSFCQMFEMRGQNWREMPCFKLIHKDQFNSRRKWVRQTIDPCYFLLDFSSRFFYLNWYQQETTIDASRIYQRTPGQVVAEACFTAYMVSNIWILKDCWHWGISEDQGLYQVVGNFNDGLCVDYFSGDCVCEDLGVVLSRQPQYFCP